MADKKISVLNAATTIFDADDFAVVQDGETKQANASVVKTYVKDGLSKSDVGLGNVDNTSDATKNSATVTLTNKTISGSSNTLSDIGNTSLTNSSITINGNAVSLGGSTTVTATASNALTLGTGLTGTSYNGSSAVTAAIDTSVVTTLTGTQTLTNKTLTSPVINGFTGTGNGSLAGALSLTGASGNLSYAGTLTGGTGVINIGSGQLYKDSSGKVGINLTPSAGTDAKLQVTGLTTNATTLATAYSAAALVVVPKSTSGFSLAIASGTGDSPQLQVSANGAAAGDLLIQPYGGNVGIGTSSPGMKLDVRCATNGGFRITDGTQTCILTPSGVGGIALYATSNHPLVFGANNTERARITAAGNLLVNDTIERGGKVVVTNTPTSQWGIDQSGSQITLTNGANAVLATGSGLIVLNSHITGEAGVYLLCGSSIFKLGGNASYVVSSTPSAGQVGVGWTGSSYAIYNNVGSTQTFGIAMIRTRAAV
jgi:hypothetical protein